MLFGIISMSSDHCHDTEATMTRNFSIVVTVTRVGHKQRPSVSIPIYPTLFFCFSHYVFTYSLNILSFLRLSCLSVSASSKTPTDALEALGSLNIIIRGHVRLRWKTSFKQNNYDKAVCCSSETIALYKSLQLHWHYSLNSCRQGWQIDRLTCSL